MQWGNLARENQLLRPQIAVAVVHLAGVADLALSDTQTCQQLQRHRVQEGLVHHVEGIWLLRNDFLQLHELGNHTVHEVLEGQTLRNHQNHHCFRIDEVVVVGTRHQTLRVVRWPAAVEMAIHASVCDDIQISNKVLGLLHHQNPGLLTRVRGLVAIDGRVPAQIRFRVHTDVLLARGRHLLQRPEVLVHVLQTRHLVGNIEWRWKHKSRVGESNVFEEMRFVGIHQCRFFLHRRHFLFDCIWLFRRLNRTLR